MHERAERIQAHAIQHDNAHTDGAFLLSEEHETLQNDPQPLHEHYSKLITYSLARASIHQKQPMQAPHLRYLHNTLMREMDAFCTTMHERHLIYALFVIYLKKHIQNTHPYYKQIRDTLVRELMQCTPHVLRKHALLTIHQNNLPHDVPQPWTHLYVLTLQWMHQAYTSDTPYASFDALASYVDAHMASPYHTSQTMHMLPVVIRFIRAQYKRNQQAVHA